MKNKIRGIVRNLIRRQRGKAKKPLRECIRIAEGIVSILTAQSFTRLVDDDVWLARYIEIIEATVSRGLSSDHLKHDDEKSVRVVVLAVPFVSRVVQHAEELKIREAASTLISRGSDMILAELVRQSLYKPEKPAVTVAA